MTCPTGQVTSASPGAPSGSPGGALVVLRELRQPDPRAAHFFLASDSQAFLYGASAASSATGSALPHRIDSSLSELNLAWM